MIDLSWLDERIPRMKRGNWLYNLVCFLLFIPRKKLTYRQYIMLLYGINKGILGEREAKAGAIIRAIEVFKSLHNGEMPNLADLENDGER